jgi:hypothetical protein
MIIYYKEYIDYQICFFEEIQGENFFLPPIQIGAILMHALEFKP